jgi:hypothetical protein
VDLYKSKVSGLLLDKTDYPPVTVTLDSNIETSKVLTPYPNTVPSGIIETHYSLEAEISPKSGEKAAHLKFQYRPIYNTTSVTAELGITDPQATTRCSVLCLSPNVYPNTPQTKERLSDLTTSMANQLLSEKVEYTRLKTEWKLKNKALLVATKIGSNSTFKIDETLDVDTLVKENLATCKQTMLEIISSLTSIKNPIDLALIMFAHETLMAELSSIRKEILAPLTNPLALLDEKTVKEIDTNVPTLLIAEEEDGYYLQIEKRLGYILPAKGESKIDAFGRNNPYLKVTLMDWISLAFSSFLTLGFMVQCVMVTTNTVKRWNLEYQRKRRDERPRYRVNKLERIEEKVLPKCESCSERREMYYTRPHPRTTRAVRKYRGDIPSHLRDSIIDVSAV